ncbi:hypothetical protein [Methanofollis fontis]|uniref:Thioredoxin-like fold domain-containing protein n=1 Tax=Methanofollis fontis TaxID=2052832 RepID=A0A483CTY1_9EURY|nr:hypothetical protein [Methanofollis fontis]TAJ44778.1 hypothetical protein CUJ86_05645 [Methanofollis fontis]
MADHAQIEIIGFSNGSCSPFPCNEDRTCGLVTCCPTESLTEAIKALKDALSEEYGERVSVSFTSLDDGVPADVQKIVEEHHPPLPMILVNGQLTPIGRISLPQIKKEIEAALD